MGTLGAAISMVPQERTANAAVLVYDEKNVEQAIKTAISTANILSNEEKQLALQIINMRSMSIEQILSYLMSHTEQQRQMWDEREAKTGALNPNISTDAFMDQCQLPSCYVSLFTRYPIWHRASFLEAHPLCRETSLSMYHLPVERWQRQQEE